MQRKILPNPRLESCYHNVGFPVPSSKDKGTSHDPMKNLPRRILSNLLNEEKSRFA